MSDIQIPKCPNCSSELTEKIGKEGSKYWACPEWKPGNQGCKGFMWSPEKKQSSGQENTMLLKDILDALKKIEENTRLPGIGDKDMV